MSAAKDIQDQIANGARTIDIPSVSFLLAWEACFFVLLIDGYLHDYKRGTRGKYIFPGAAEKLAQYFLKTFGGGGFELLFSFFLYRLEACYGGGVCQVCLLPCVAQDIAHPRTIFPSWYYRLLRIKYGDNRNSYTYTECFMCVCFL